jgi:hypothetical protein
MLEPHAQWLMAVAFAVPALVMSHQLWRVWRNPLAIEGGAWVNRGVGIFVMEFILTHAGVFLASTAVESHSSGVRWGAILGLGLFYGLFALAIAVGFRSRSLFWSFVWLIGGRAVALAIGISEQTSDLLHTYAVTSAVLYFAMVILSVFLPWPRFGITAELARDIRLPGSSGLWVDQPHRAIGAATVYFFLLAVVEVGWLSWAGF